MNQTRALPWVIDILDDGLRLYRRFMSDFIVATAALLIPIAIASLLVNGLVLTVLGRSWALLSAFFLVCVTYPLLMYSVAVLSRMGAQAIQTGRPDFRSSLRMPPLRIAGMGCYSFVFMIIASMGFGVLGVICSCVALGFTSMTLVGSLTSLSSLAFISIGGTAFLYVLFGSAVGISVVYGIQSFALEQHDFGTSISRLNDFLFFRTGRNILCFIAGGGIFATMLIAYSGTVAAIWGLVSSRMNLNTTTQTNTVLGILLLVASLIVLFPPLPIWMSLLYLRLRQEREGGDLEQRIGEWAGVNQQPQQPS